MSDKLNRNPLFAADGIVILLYAALLAFGWISICGASHEIGNTDFFGWDTRTGKQLVWMGCSFVLGFILLMTDDRYFDTLTDLLYIAMMVLLLITPLLATDIKGSYSWLKLGSISIQPAEFAKCITALALAKLINQYGFTLSNTRQFMQAVGIVLLPMVLIIMQRETGSALVFCAFFLMFYREGMPGSILFVAAAAVAYFVIGIRYAETPFAGTPGSVGEFVVLLLIWLFTVGMVRIYCPRKPHAFRLLLWGASILLISLPVAFFIYPFDLSWALLAICIGCAGYLAWQSLGERLSRCALIALFTLGSTAFLYSADYALNNILEPHQQTRIRVLLGIEDDPTGAGYNVNQSKIAIGSGGLEGKGFMNGTQTKLKYVPEQDTDFIFCTVGEEEGFLGASAVLLLFLTLILRLIALAERQPTVYGRVYGYCVMSILLFHLTINVGMVLGIMPVIGIPLPFFSYGGSSLWGFTLLLFIFLRVDAAGKSKRR